MSHEIERRVMVTGAVELRAAQAEGAIGTLVGYAAVYDSISENLGGFREIIRKGAFNAAIAEGDDVMARSEHASSMLLGRRSSGTLRLSLDEKGLRYEVDVPDTQAGRDTLTLVKRGDVSKSSFAFMLRGKSDEAQRWSQQEDGTALRELLNLRLIDVAPIFSEPAYQATQVSARVLEEARALTTASAAPVVDGSEPMEEPVPAPEPAPPAPEEDRVVPLETLTKLNDLLGGVVPVATPTKAEAWARFLAERKGEEARDASLEDKLAAVWGALYDLLGYPWRDGVTPWRIEETFGDRVIVETTPGKLFAYPITFAADNTVTVGTGTPVEAQYVPLAG